MIPVIFIVGPTAVGKSDFAIDLALESGGEIISADSMQIYKGLDLGTAKLKDQEMKGVPHHMIDIADPRVNYSVGEYSKTAQSIIDEISKRGKQVIVCGGSGLYVHSLLYEMDFSGCSVDEKLREQLTLEAEQKGNEHLFAKLTEIDPSAAERVHPNNTKRVIRALERAYGDIEEGGLRDFSATFGAKRRYDSTIIRLTSDRKALYERIERRAEKFFENGLIDEVRGLLNNGIPKDANSMQGLGYKEIVSFLDGQFDETEALRLVKQNTRRFAKRQETWFKRYTDAEIINVNEADKA